MAEVKFDCPWCDVKGGAFTSISEFHSGVHERRFHGRGMQKYQQRFVTFKCRRCRSGVIARMTNIDCSDIIDIHGLDGDPGERGWKTNSHHPANPVADPCPEHVPDRVKSRFNEARENYQGKRWDSAGMMYRKTLDVATKDLIRANWPEDKVDELIAKWLRARIQILKGKDIITPALSEWAHDIIKEEGDDAAHDEEPFTEEQSEALHYFTRLFLTYAYELPVEVKLHSGGLDKNDGEEKASD